MGIFYVGTFVWLRAHCLEHAARVVTAAHGHLATAADFKNAAIVLAQDFDETFNLAFHAGHFYHQRLGSEINDARAKHLNQVEDLRAVARRCSHLDQREFARDVGRLGDVIYVDDIFKLEEARANAIAGLGRSFAHKCETRQSGSFTPAHSEGADVDVQAAKQRGDAGEHARQVFNVSDKRVQHKNKLLA